MTDPNLLRGLLLAGEYFAAATLLPVLAWLVATCFPNRAALRHLIWLMTFIGLMVLPPIALLLPACLVIEQPTVPVTDVSVAAIPTTITFPTTLPAIKGSVPAAPARTNADAPNHMDVIAPTPRYLELGQIARGAFALWLIGFTAVLLYYAIAVQTLIRLHRRSRAQAMPIPRTRRSLAAAYRHLSR